jgi:hypothetical protein
MRRSIPACLAAMLAVGCLSQSTPVRLQGDPLAIRSLAGRWVGEFWGGAGGRGGSLTLTLSTGSDSLYGDVTMFDPAGQQMRAADPIGAHRMQMQSTQRLRIDFAWVNGSTVRGTVEPYLAADCACVVSSAFYGEVVGDRITGRFVLRSAGGVLAEGPWGMKRTSGPQ